MPFVAKHADDIMDGEYVELWSSQSSNLEKLESYTLELDGNPVLALGPGVGESWMLANDIMQVHPLTISRAVKRSFFSHIEEKGYWRVQANVRAGWHKAEKFAEFIGMRREGLMMKFGPLGEDHYRYAWVK